MSFDQTTKLTNPTKCTKPNPMRMCTCAWDRLERSAKMRWLNEIASLYKMLYKMQLASKSHILLARSGVGDLKIPRRKACRFDSGPGHQQNQALICSSQNRLSLHTVSTNGQLTVVSGAYL